MKRRMISDSPIQQVYYLVKDNTFSETWTCIPTEDCFLETCVKPSKEMLLFARCADWVKRHQNADGIYGWVYTGKLHRALTGNTARKT